MSATLPTNALSSIVKDQGDNTLLRALERRKDRGRELAIARVFSSLDALNLLRPRLHEYARIRLLFGDDAAPRARLRLIEELRRRSDEDLFEEHPQNPALTGPRGFDLRLDVWRACLP